MWYVTIATYFLMKVIGWYLAQIIRFLVLLKITRNIVKCNLAAKQACSQISKYNNTKECCIASYMINSRYYI